MKIRQLELSFWQFLEMAFRQPETANLKLLCDALEQSLPAQSLSAQLNVAGDVFVRLSEVCAARAELLLAQWETRHNPSEPVVNLEKCVNLFVQALSLDMTDLLEESEPTQYPANRKRKSIIQANDSVVGEVNKDILLNWVDQMTAEYAFDETSMAEQILNLAHEENIQAWSREIAQHLQCVDTKIRLSDLQQALNMPMVELWLGLLLGGFCLEQQGEFYNSQTLWIISDGNAL